MSILSFDEFAVELAKVMDRLDDQRVSDRLIRNEVKDRLQVILDDANETAAADRATRPTKAGTVATVAAGK